MTILVMENLPEDFFGRKYIHLNSLSSCCISTPLTLASGEIRIFSLVINQPTSPSIWTAVLSVHKSCYDNVDAVRRDDVCVSVYNANRSDFTLTLCTIVQFTRCVFLFS